VQCSAVQFTVFVAPFATRASLLAQNTTLEAVQIGTVC